MKVFISWSGEKSKAIASIFKDWIPAVVQAAKPYFSPNDIEKGSRWSSEIAKELEESSIGLICLTDDNLQAPWLMFEAGALSKSMDKARVCPMLFGVEPTDLAGPLVQFQGTPFSKEEVLKLIRTINTQLGEAALDGGVLNSVFEKWWPDLAEKVEKALKNERKAVGGELRSDRELLEEVLKITRTLFVRDKVPPNRHAGVVYPLSIRVTSELIERNITFAGDILERVPDVPVLIATKDHLEASLTPLFELLPEEFHRRLAPRADSMIAALNKRVEELEEIPF
ncbi:toll/interleukin-1 receptor domain-containing protein [Thauera sp. CAU 1555]|uniref:Toll/interleukin-1 receptor domain-containing protein n=1 Tax=Thauera sedimentorum TaxID=2767595 RepID=A0ABR9B6F4_9RHOO|nr:toll/interleukin-1 receptor domain-containing protein [Thauera sedimentorum]MBD8501578.1 toll/interleukin-1 receptor domain-containing protein [Thauera sedimentorum]